MVVRVSVSSREARRADASVKSQKSRLRALACLLPRCLLQVPPRCRRSLPRCLPMQCALQMERATLLKESFANFHSCLKAPSGMNALAPIAVLMVLKGGV